MATPAPRGDRLSPTAWNLAALLVLMGALAILRHINPDVGTYYGIWEGSHYAAMVDAPLRVPVDPHYGYRLFPPLLVALIPGNHQTAWTWLNDFFLLWAAWFSFLILKMKHDSPALPLLCAVFFLAMPACTQWLQAYGAQPDALYLAELALGFWLIERRRPVLLAALLLVGSFTKITILLLAVVHLYAVEPMLPRPWRWRWQHRTRLRPLWVLIPALVAWVAIHQKYPPAVDGYRMIDDVGGNIEMKLLWTSSMWPGVLPQVTEFILAFFVVYGVGAFILMHQWAAARDVWRQHRHVAWFLGLSMFTAFIGSYDDARSHTYAAVPVLFILVGVLGKDPRWVKPGVWMPLLLIQLLLSDFAFTPPADFSTYMPHYMSPEQARHMLLKLGVAFLGYAVVWRQFTRTAHKEAQA